MQMSGDGGFYAVMNPTHVIWSSGKADGNLEMAKQCEIREREPAIDSLRSNPSKLWSAKWWWDTVWVYLHFHQQLERSQEWYFSKVQWRTGNSAALHSQNMMQLWLLRLKRPVCWLGCQLKTQPLVRRKYQKQACQKQISTILFLNGYDKLKVLIPKSCCQIRRI